MDTAYSIVLRSRTEKNVVCQPGSSGQGSGSIQQDCQGCICTSTLCYERLQCRVCRISSLGSRVPNAPGFHFVVSESVSQHLDALEVLCILGANDEWQRLEALWWITYVSTSRLRYVSSFHHRFLGYNTGQCLMVDEWYSHRYATRSSSNIPFPVC